VLVTGEAGIGKTALVAEAGREARGRRAVVLFGACWEGEGVPGYWPWIQVVRALERVASPAAWAGEDAATITLETLLATGALTWSSS
jgi:predicted ATPase